MMMSSDDVDSDEQLIAAALKAMEKAYAPYSNFCVGAAVLTAEGTIVTGANVENASYGLAICAERVAVFNAVTAGEQSIVKIAIVSSSGAFTYPCGACRQVLREFRADMEVLVTDDVGNIKKYSLEELLPNSFGPEDLT